MRLTVLPNQTGGNMMALPYNREILEKAGLNEPSATWGDPEWNWDAYIDMAKKTTVTEGGNCCDCRRFQHGYRRARGQSSLPLGRPVGF